MKVWGAIVVLANGAAPVAFNTHYFRNYRRRGMQTSHDTGCNVRHALARTSAHEGMTDGSLALARFRDSGPFAKWRSGAIGARVLLGAAMLVQATAACAQPAHPTIQRMDQLPAGARLLHTQSATVGEPERRIVGSMAEWEALWRSLYGGMPAPPLPSVDFSRDVVAFATMGTRSTGGFELDIAGTRRIGKDLDVLVIETVPAPDCILTQVESTPTVAVRVPRAPGVVRFSVQRKTQRC